MSDPFSTPPPGGRGGRGRGRGAATPSTSVRGRGTPPGGGGGGRNTPDPFRTPPRVVRRTNPFVGPAAWSGWSSSSSEGNGSSIGGRALGRGERGGGGLFGRGGGGLFGRGGGGLFGRGPTEPADDPFGGSSMVGGAERQEWLRRAKESFSDELRFTVETTTVTTSGVQLRGVEMLDAGRAPRRPGNAGFSQPYFFLEYLENGTLGQFQKRITNVTTLTLPSGLEIPFLLPNRLLWSIFLCLIRTCVGMAWPPDGPNVVLEVPAPPEPLTLAHMDMHNDNGRPSSSTIKYGFSGTNYQLQIVMFGDLDENEAEHRTVPIAKLIDFGEASERPAGEYGVPPDPSVMNSYDNVLLLATYRPNTGRRNQGIDRNLLDVGVLMANLIANVRSFVVTSRRNMMDTSIHPYLDEDLRLLIQRCLAVDPENRPRLEELIELVDRVDSPFFRDEKYYKKGNGPATMGAVNPAEQLETDDALNVIVQTYILNAGADSSSRI
ncbi:hypothetical protein CHU98_g5134 [Xylaria longipes]|nr:hypothetical protein CHU98_g5134 [Xylaria longipes]